MPDRQEQKILYLRWLFDLKKELLKTYKNG